MQDFLLAIDALNCHTYEEKLKWSLTLWDKRGKKALGIYGLKRVLQLLDQVEEDGFVDGPSEHELEKIISRRSERMARTVEDRVEDVLRLYPITRGDGLVTFEQLQKVPEKMIACARK